MDAADAEEEREGRSGCGGRSQRRSGKNLIGFVVEDAGDAGGDRRGFVSRGVGEFDVSTVELERENSLGI
jgi:hypothetical protein